MARSRPPSFDFYPEDFLAGTMHLHPICIGIYIRLLCFQWSHGAIPSERRQLMQVTGAMPDELDGYLSQVLQKFEKGEDGQYRNARLERERARKTAVSQSRANAAGARWSSRPSEHGESNGDANASANASANDDAKHMLPNRKREVGSRKQEEGSSGVRKKAQEETIGEWVIPQNLDTEEVRLLLDEFEIMRRDKIGKPIKDRAASSRRLKKFRDVQHLVDTLEACIAEGWQGLDPTYIKPEGGQPRQQTFAQMRLANTKLAVEEFVNGE